MCMCVYIYVCMYACMHVCMSGKKINECEMWIWRKMQRISWTEKKTNESVCMEIGIEEDEKMRRYNK